MTYHDAYKTTSVLLWQQDYYSQTDAVTADWRAPGTGLLGPIYGKVGYSDALVVP